MGRKAFKDFIQVRNLQNGAWVDGRMVSVNFDLIVGPITFKSASWHVSSGSIRFNAGPFVKFKPTYIGMIREMVKGVVTARQQQKREEQV